MEKKKKNFLLSVLFWIILWQLAAMAVHQRIILVSPIDVAMQLSVLLKTGDFYLSIVSSLLRIAFGFFLGSFFGILSAVLSNRSSLFESFLAPLVAVIKAAPVASFIILVLFYVPSRNVSIVISFLMVFPILYENTLAGLRSCDPKMLEMAQVFHLSRRERIHTIYFSHLLPYLESAFSLALGLAWKSGIAAEVIGMPSHSIGDHLYESKIYLDTPSLFAWTIVIVLLSFLFQKGFAWLLSKLAEKVQREE